MSDCTDLDRARLLVRQVTQAFNLDTTFGEMVGVIEEAVYWASVTLESARARAAAKRLHRRLGSQQTWTTQAASIFNGVAEVLRAVKETGPALSWLDVLCDESDDCDDYRVCTV
jgi:hypothetical protein